jgi:phospholipid transport system substrate-binding protein
MAKLADAALAHGNHSESSEQDLVDAVHLFLAEYTDVQYAAHLIIGSHWKTATPGQRYRFVEAYNNHVTNLLVKFVPDIKFVSLRIDPFHGNTEETPLMIRATFRTSDKQTVHFVLVIHEREGRWLIFDVIAEGISYVKIYRNQFTGEITKTGLEAMIERFEIRSTGRGND